MNKRVFIWKIWLPHPLMERHLRPQLQVRLRLQQPLQYQLEPITIRLQPATITTKKDDISESHQRTRFHLPTIMNLLLIQGIWRHHRPRLWPFGLSNFISRTYGSGSYNESPPIANRAPNRQTSSIFGKTSSVGAGTIGTNTSEILLNPSHSFGSTFTSSKNSLRSSRNSLQNPNQEPRTNPEGDSNGTGKFYVIMTSLLRHWKTFYFEHEKNKNTMITEHNRRLLKLQWSYDRSKVTVIFKDQL